MKPWLARQAHKLRLAAWVLAISLLVFLAGAGSWPDLLRGMRPVNPQDELYRYVAQELNEPALCDEIPWSAESPGGFFLAPSYERSNCYAFIAGRTKNPWLCWKVQRLGPFRLLSHQTSMWSCLADARHGLQAGIAVSPEDLAGFFNRLGYDPDTLHLEGVTPPVVSVKDFYRQLASRPDILERIGNAIGTPLRSDAPPGNDPANVAYLADMAALVAKTAGWCARIPTDLPLAGQRAGFRDWCLFTLASNSRNSELCRLIPVPDGARDPRLSLRADCERQSRSPYPGGQYGPEVPDSDGRMRTLFAMLHLEIPQAKDLPAGTVAAAYERFLKELSRGTSRQHTAARQRLIARVRALAHRS